MDDISGNQRNAECNNDEGDPRRVLVPQSAKNQQVCNQNHDGGHHDGKYYGNQQRPAERDRPHLTNSQSHQCQHAKGDICPHSHHFTLGKIGKTHDIVGNAQSHRAQGNDRSVDQTIDEELDHASLPFWAPK